MPGGPGEAVHVGGGRRLRRDGCGRASGATSHRPARADRSALTSRRLVVMRAPASRVVSAEVVHLCEHESFGLGQPLPEAARSLSPHSVYNFDCRRHSGSRCQRACQDGQPARRPPSQLNAASAVDHATPQAEENLLHRCGERGNRNTGPRTSRTHSGPSITVRSLTEDDGAHRFPIGCRLFRGHRWPRITLRTGPSPAGVVTAGDGVCRRA